MLQALTWLELLLGLTFAVVSLGEILSLLIARRRCKTRNISRLATHGIMSSLMFVYLVHAQIWLRLVESPETMDQGAHAATIWPLPAMAFTVGLIAIYELIDVSYAFVARRGRTLDRLVSHLVMVALLAGMAGAIGQKWSTYFGQLGPSRSWQARVGSR